jgi:peptide/nickel transport system substrate-binding protein
MKSISWLSSPRSLILACLLIALASAVACGGAADVPEPVVVEKEVITEIQVTKEVVTEVQQEQTKVVVREVVATATPIPVLMGQTFMSPLTPDWVAQGKYQPMVLEVVGRGRSGQWDVHYCASLFSCLIGAAPKFNGLVQYDPANPSEVTGDLAKEWEVSPDGTLYTFTLHEANWHDGTPVTADDVVFTLDRIAEPGAIRSRTAALRTFYDQGNARAVDSQTVEVPLKFPGATFLTNLAVDYFKIYPEKSVAGLSQEDANCCPENIVGSGPWKLANWDRGTAREYERNTDYFKPSRPFFDGLKFNVIRDINRVYAALQVGQAHVTDGPWSSTFRPEDMYRLQDDTNGRLRAGLLLGGSGTFFILHQNKPPFDDPRVRQAFYLGLDRQNVVDIVYCTDAYGCFATPATFFARGSVAAEEDISDVPGFRRTADGLKDPRDIAEAKRLMAEAGYPDGIELDLNSGNSATGIKVAEVATQQLRSDIGIDFTLHPVDTATYHVHTREGTHHATLVGGIGLLTRDPADILLQVYVSDIEKNPDNWTTPRLSELMDAQASELDRAARQAQFSEMVDILREGEGHWVPQTWVDQGASIDYRLQGFNTPDSIQHLHNWEYTWWDPDAACPDERGCVDK